MDQKITSADIETLVRCNVPYQEDYTFLCGREFFEMVARHINDGSMTLDTLKKCISIDGRIFDNKPYDRSGSKFFSPSARQRMVLLKKAHMIVVSSVKRDPILLLEDRLRRLEQKVKVLEEKVDNS